MSDLPRDLVEEVLCRVPLTSLGTVRSICKKWNTLSKDLSFGKKHLAGQAKLATTSEREFMVVMIMKDMVYLMSVNLHNNDFESCIKRQGKVISLDVEVDDVSQLYHCKGLLLGLTEYNIILIVWNPYLGQAQWLRPPSKCQRFEKYTHALGYDKSNKSYKILKFIIFYYSAFDDGSASVESEIYDINSSSLRVLDVPPQDWWVIEYSRRGPHGVSLNGNTYWLATGTSLGTRESALDKFLVCFDFTSETFGPRLPLPFELDSYLESTLMLSSVREEKLAVLFQQHDTSMIEIWITTKIEPNEVLWSSKVFLAVDMSPSTCSGFTFKIIAASFFIDEEKMVAVVFNQNVPCSRNTSFRNVAYIVGVDGTLKRVDLGETAFPFCSPHVCSYVPSLMQL